METGRCRLRVMIEEEFSEKVVGFSVRSWLEVCLGWKNVEKVV